ncbi:MAG: DUF1841 family protein [Gammaproteobacteria bacterium]|nr:DUF1841 family protein [Gammaproteobacteria bacterium]
MFSNNRTEMRKIFFTAWNKHQQHLLIDGLDKQLVEIILLHPEYQSILNHPEKFQDYDFGTENPFLHMSLHLAIREQVNTNRPLGIATIYKNLSEKLQDTQQAEHRMLECLENFLWETQQSGNAPDEKKYLMRLEELEKN